MPRHSSAATRATRTATSTTPPRERPRRWPAWGSAPVTGSPRRCPNHPDIVVACLGAMRLGAIWLGINRALAPPEKAYLLGDAEPSVTLADPEMTEQLRDLGGGRLVTVDPEDPASEWATLAR